MKCSKPSNLGPFALLVCQETLFIFDRREAAYVANPASSRKGFAMPTALDPHDWSQIVLAALGIVSAIVSGLLAQRLLIVRRTNAEALARKDIELEHQKEATAIAQADRAKAQADHAIAQAESQRILNESEAKLLRAQADAKQMGQISELMLSELGMLEKAFNRVADDSADSRTVQGRVAEALNKQADTLAVLSTLVTNNHAEIVTNLGDIAGTLNRVALDVDGKISPLYGKMAEINSLLASLTNMVQGTWISILTEHKPSPTSPFPVPVPDNSEVKP